MCKHGIVEERIQWLLEYAKNTSYNHINLGDQELEEAFTARFPEARRSQTPVAIGYAPTPMLRQAARQAWKQGRFRRRWTVGNQDTYGRMFSTYTVCYSL